MKQFLFYVVTLLCFTCTVGAQVSIGDVPPPKDGQWYKIRVVKTGKYLSVENASKDNGARIVQTDYTGRHSQRFMVKKTADGMFSFFAGHSNKSICTDKGDGREGDMIIQNTLSQYFGKWHLRYLIQTGCLQGWQIVYNSNTGKPMQISGEANGAFCQLIEPKHQDGDFDCCYVFQFEPVEEPPMMLQSKGAHYKPLNVEKAKKN